jgi:CheY-like chemotaxis protein
VLLDAQMPEMDGFSVAAQMQQDPILAGTTVLMLSSADLAGDTVRCRELGIALHLMKPITQLELWDAIMKVLSRREPARSALLPAPPPTRLAPHGSLRILLAEDNAVNQKVVTRMLEKHDHSVVVVGDGHAVMAALAQESFDLVLMDVQMPGMGGLEATAIIREQERTRGTHLPIIALTASAMQGDREKCLAAGMDSYVVKPLQAQDLYAAIEQLLPGTAPSQISS